MLKTRAKPPVEAQESSEEAAREIGRRLREAREARSERLDDIADYLRIRPAYLEALEAGELGQIPGRPYAIGFLRSYAGYLGLSGEELVSRLKGSIGKAAAPELVYREPVAEPRRGTTAMVAASVVLAAAVYTGYYVIYHVDRGPAAPVAEAPGEVAKLATETLRRSETQRSAAAVPAVPPALSARESGSAPDASSAVAREAPELAQASTPSAASAAAAPAGELLAALDSERAGPRAVAAEPAGRVSLLALESSWVQVRSASRDYVRTRTLAPGERFTVPNRSDLALWTGNAGGVELIVDGRSRGPLGRPGEVVKNMSLAADQFRNNR